MTNQDVTTLSIKAILEMRIEELFQINAPLLRKILDGQLLTAEERALHESILDEAQRRLTSLEQSDRAARDEYMARRQQEYPTQVGRPAPPAYSRLKGLIQ